MNSHDARPHEPSSADAPGGSETEAGAPATGGASGAGAPATGGASGAGVPAWRQLSFRASGLTIELEITGSGGCQRLAGQLVPRQSAVVEIRASGGVITVEADPLGRFSADTVPLGPVSLRCRLGGANRSPVVTGWVTL